MRPSVTIFPVFPTKSRLSFPLLPANPLLIPPWPMTSVPSLNLPLGALQGNKQTPSLMVIVAEGMLPIQTKLREDVPRGVDLSKLLGDSDPVPDEASLVIEGQ